MCCASLKKINHQMQCTKLVSWSQLKAMHISAQLTGIDPAICLTMPQAPLCMSYMRGIFERPNRAIVFLQYELVQKSSAQPRQRLRCPQCICEARWACPGEMPWDNKEKDRGGTFWMPGDRKEIWERWTLGVRRCQDAKEWLESCILGCSAPLQMNSRWFIGQAAW